ncbi:unnamed protein product [Triticum turgidum subsp. durum]|uniref:Secreted protein n=1 Tax=Triticum turgidum subsp. durum TaxID=4567 RepID=A0A9R0ZD99_TRITD|nr:unnamed protein product [Triticum turgidum subsp. durum]
MLHQVLLLLLVCTSSNSSRCFAEAHQTHMTTLAVHSHHHRPFTATTHGRHKKHPKVQTIHEDKGEEEAAGKS